MITFPASEAFQYIMIEHREVLSLHYFEIYGTYNICLKSFGIVSLHVYMCQPSISTVCDLTWKSSTTVFNYKYRWRRYSCNGRYCNGQSTIWDMFHVL